MTTQTTPQLCPKGHIPQGILVGDGVITYRCEACPGGSASIPTGAPPAAPDEEQIEVLEELGAEPATIHYRSFTGCTIRRATPKELLGYPVLSPQYQRVTCLECRQRLMDLMLGLIRGWIEEWPAATATEGGQVD